MFFQQPSSGFPSPGLGEDRVRVQERDFHQSERTSLLGEGSLDRVPQFDREERARRSSLAKRVEVLGRGLRQMRGSTWLGEHVSVRVTIPLALFLQYSEKSGIGQRRGPSRQQGLTSPRFRRGSPSTRPSSSSAVCWWYRVLRPRGLSSYFGKKFENEERLTS